MKKLRGVWGIIIAVLVVFSAIFGALLFSADASTGPTSQGLNTLGGYGIANETSAVWALNTSSHTWYQLSFSVNKATNEVTFSTPLNQKISLIIIQTKNLSQSVYDLLQNNALFTYTDLTQTGNDNLSNAYMYFGSPVNATSTNAKADKGITNYIMNQTLYDEAGSNFGSSVQLNAITYFASSFGSTPQYALFFNQSANATGGYSSVSLTFTQYFEYTSGQQYPLVSYVSMIAIGILVLAMFVTYLAAPEYEGDEEERARAFQTKREIGLVIVGIAGAVAILIIEGFLGSYTPTGGWGAAMASWFFFGLFTYAYTEIPQRQKYTTTLGIGLIGMVLGFILNMFFPFGSIIYNFMVSVNIFALIAGWMTVVFFLVLSYYGLMDTKRYKLKHRHRVREKHLRA